MTDSAFLAQAMAQVTLRPRKLGYLIQAGSGQQLRRAIRYAASEWGGIGHPIVPVRRRKSVDPGWWQLLELLSPDVMIDYVGIETSLRAALERRVGANTIPAIDLRAGNEPGVHSLVAIPPGSLRARTLLVPPPHSTVGFEAALGVLEQDEDSIDAWQETGATIATADRPVDLLNGQIDVPSPMWATRQQFSSYATSVIGAPVTVFTDTAPSTARAVRFWNVRAAAAVGHDIHVLWLPLGHLEDPEVARRLRELCLSKLQTSPDLLLLGRDGPRLHQAAQRMGFTELEEGKSTTMLMGPRRDIGVAPPTYWTQIDPRGWVYGERSEGTRTAVPVVVSRPQTTVHVESPVTLNRRVRGLIRVDVDQLPILAWPRRAATARLFADNAQWTYAGLGQVVGPSATFRLALKVPEAVDVLTACLREAGWQWSVSDKGKYAGALLAAAGGGETISSLSDRQCLAVIRALTSLTSRKAAVVLRPSVVSRMTDEDLESLVRRALPSLTPRWLTGGEVASAPGVGLSRAAAIDVLNRLIADGLVLRAFRFTCPTCGLTSHVAFDRAADRIRCDGCTATSPVFGAAGEPDVAYALNSLLDRAADQDCHVHLPVQDWMRRQLGVVWSVPGANVTRGEEQREVDVLGVSKDQIIVAEVKASSVGFLEAEVVKAAKLASELKADHLVLAAFDDWPAGRETVETFAKRWTPNVTILGLADLAAEHGTVRPPPSRKPRRRG